ncbi:LuxR C-terminal-related transcriptional regulator [Variovorax robiniae]|uniref:LuxR C-terminal-related transcriptional regulator n=1 Tax=Variovorax robiniae TaxID=1836199 RepID=A0ABU8XAA5_9BURK
MPPKAKAPATVALQSLVKTKLVPPRSAGRMVERDKLITQLLEARRLRCFVLQGPAGCGKTMTLVAWRQALLPLGFHVAWLTLAPEDNELTRFLDYLVASIAQVDKDIVREATELAGHGVDGEAVERLVIALVRGMARHGGEITLMLDDLQHLADPRIHEALQWLIDYAPANLHLVLASRGAVAVSLTRLRSRGLVLELDLRDLRFSPAESERFLRSRVGAISHRDAMRVHELSDGWVAGLQLLAVDWKQRWRQAGGEAIAPADFVRAQVQNDQAFSAYFEREVLSRLAPAELELLINVSICNRFCAPLCAVLVGRDATVASMVVLLTRLEADNLFIIQVESHERDTWYRLHPLLRETLHERLGRRSAQHGRDIHLAAWNWFRENGLLDEAVRHGVLAGEADAAADLVERTARALEKRGDLRKLIGLVRQLPPVQVQARVELRLWMIRLALYSRDFDGCAASITRLAADIPEGDAPNRFYLAILQATLAVQRDDPDAAMAVLPRLLQTPPEADAMLVGGRDNILSWLYMYRGEYERARQVQFDNPLRLVDGVPLLGTSSGTLQGRCLIGLSFALEGRMTQAERIYREVLREAESGGPACVEPALLATALLGEVLVEIDEIDAALRLLEDRVDVLERASIPDSVLRLLLMLSIAHWTSGRQLESMAYLERLEDFATGVDLDRLLAHSLGMQVHYRILMGDLLAAEGLVKRLDDLEARHRDVGGMIRDEIFVMAERARVRLLMAQGDFEHAAMRIEPLIAFVESRNRYRLNAQLQLLRAVIELRRGRHTLAVECALDALRGGHRVGLMRTLVDADPVAQDLIRELGEDPALDPVLAFYAERLVSASRASQVPAGTAAPSVAPIAGQEALSERERDVVRLLAQTMPNKKIARTLGVSPETVKWHLKNIYLKLGVAGRDEAVARVRDLQWGEG